MRWIRELIFGDLLSRVFEKWRCPRCNYPLYENEEECPNCEQPIEWPKPSPHTLLKNWEAS